MQRAGDLFNPLTSTSDRSLLEDTLEIDVTWEDGSVVAWGGGAYIKEPHNGTLESKQSARSLAVLKVAAEIRRRKG